MFPSIAIIIPTCNWADRIEPCLQMIVKQKYEGKLELIAIDCGSTDGTKKMLKAYGFKVLEHRNTWPDGLNGLVNYGIKKSSSDLIWKVDGDNIMKDENVLQGILKPFLEIPKLNVSIPFPEPCESFKSFTNFQSILEALYLREVYEAGTNFGSYSVVNDLWHGLPNSSLFRREDILDVGGWDRDIRILMRLRDSGKSKAALVPGAKFYHDQRSGPKDYMIKMSKRLNFFNQIDEFFKNDYFVKWDYKSESLVEKEYNIALHSIILFIKTRQLEYLWGIILPFLDLAVAFSKLPASIKLWKHNSIK